MMISNSAGFRNQLLVAFLLSLFIVGPGFAESKKTEVSSIKPSELRGFDSYPAKVKEMITYALHLTTQELKYQYGSNSPAKGGMDCSGTVQHILTLRKKISVNVYDFWTR